MAKTWNFSFYIESIIWQLGLLYYYQYQIEA